MINTNGYIKDGFTNGGGIIKDRTEHCIKEFSSSYGLCLILEVELKVIVVGVLHTRGLASLANWLKADSTMTIHCITREWRIMDDSEHS